MSEETQRVYLSDKMKALITPDLPIKMPNQPFKTPKDKPYGEFWIMGGDSFDVGFEGMTPAGLIKRRVRHVHMIQLTIYVPEGQGTKAATTAGDQFKDRFDGRQGRDADGQLYRFGNIQPFTPKIEGFACFVYRIPYTRDTIECRSPGLTL